MDQFFPMPGQKRPEGLLTDADLRAAVKARVQAQLAGLWREPQPGDPVDVEIPGVAASTAFLETQAARLKSMNEKREGFLEARNGA